MHQIAVKVDIYIVTKHFYFK